VSLIALGAVLLACTTGYLSWAVWVSIFALWPVLLISAGIDIIGKSTGRDWLRALSSVVFIAALLYGAFVMPAGTWGLPWSAGAAGEAFSQREVAAKGVTDGTARIEAGATQLTLKGGTDLIAISGESPVGSRPTISVNHGPATNVSVEQPRQTVVWVGVSPRRRLDVLLGKDMRWTALDINAGATQGEIDLSELDVERLVVNAGASDTRITFGANAAVAEVQAGAANMTFRVPRGNRVNVRLSGAFTSASVSSDFTRESGNGFIGDTVWSAGGTGPAIDITVRAGVASLNIERY
jgi:hypothetical protein